MEENFRKKANQQLELIAYQVNKVIAKYGYKIPFNCKDYIQMVTQINLMNLSCFTNFTTMLSVQQLQALFRNYDTLIQDLVLKIDKYANTKQQRPKIVEHGICKLCSQNITLSNIENNIQSMREQLGTGFIGGLGKEYKKQGKLFSQNQDRAFFLQLQKVLQSKERNIVYQQSKIQQYIDSIVASINQMEQLKKFEPEQAKNTEPVDQHFAVQIQQYFLNRFSVKIPPWLKRIFELFKKVEQERIAKDYNNIHSNKFMQTDDWEPPELIQSRKHIIFLSKELEYLKGKNKQFDSKMDQLSKSKQYLQVLIGQYQVTNDKNHKFNLLQSKLSYNNALSNNQNDKLKRKSDSSYNYQTTRETQQETKISQQQNSYQNSYVIFPQKKSKFKRIKGLSSFLRKNNLELKLPRISNSYKINVSEPHDQIQQQGHEYKLRIKQNTMTETRQQSEMLPSKQLQIKSHYQRHKSSISEFQDNSKLTRQLQNQSQEIQIPKNKAIRIEKKLSQHIHSKFAQNLPFKNRMSVLNKQNNEMRLQKNYNNDISQKEKPRLIKKKVDMSKIDRCAFNHLQRKNRQYNGKQVGIQAFFADQKETLKKLQILFEDLKKSFSIPSDLTLNSLQQIFCNIFEPKYKLDVSITSKIQTPQKGHILVQKRGQQANKDRKITTIEEKANLKQQIAQQKQRDQLVRKKAKSLLRCCNIIDLNHIKQAKNQSIFVQKDLQLFINQEKAIKYEQSLAQNYHKKRSINFTKPQLIFFSSLHRVQQLIKQHSKEVHRNICAFIRYPYQSIRNKFDILNITSQLSLNTFLSYSQRIMWLHRNCPKSKDSQLCSHILQFSDKIHIILGTLVKLQQDHYTNATTL